MELLRRNSDGFTLVEFLVATVIIMVGLLALLQSVNISLAHNLANILRNQAVMLADDRMAQEKALPFDSITPGTSSSVVNLNAKGAFKNYSVVRINTDLTANTRKIEINVVWKHKGTRYIHSASSLVSRHQ
jgi:type IV pilus assembly protein PilV